jgi:hypothetical protein
MKSNSWGEVGVKCCLVATTRVATVRSYYLLPLGNAEIYISSQFEETLSAAIELEDLKSYF